MTGPAHPSRTRAGFVALVVASGAYGLQQMMVIPTLPVLQQEFHTTPELITWVLTMFLLASAVSTPLLGKLGDQFGRKRLLEISLAVFLVGTVLAACAVQLWMLILARIVQGASGAIQPLSLGLTRDLVPRERLARAMGTIAGVAAIAGGVGIVIAGPILDHVSFRVLFALPAVFIAFSLYQVRRHVRERSEPVQGRVDVAGAVALAVAIAALILALTEGRPLGWLSWQVLGLFLLSGAAVLAWIAIELHVETPMVDMRMVTERTVTIANVTVFLGNGLAMAAIFILVPRLVAAPNGLDPATEGLVHYGLAASATLVALYLAPLAAMGILTGPLLATLERRFGTRAALSFGFVLAAIALASLAAFHDHGWQIILATCLAGIAAPLMATAVQKLVVDSVPQSSIGVATGMNVVLRQVGAVVGGQLCAVILTTWTIAGTTAPTESAYIVGFVGAALVCLVGAVLAFGAPRRAKQLVAQQQPA
jgi:MFS family permease